MGAGGQRTEVPIGGPEKVPGEDKDSRGVIRGVWYSVPVV